MFTHITQLLPKKNLRRLAVSIALFWMCLYPIYTNYFYGKGFEHYYRHIAYLEGRSMFFNPWQYRVLAPAIIEGGFDLYNATVHRLFDVESYIYGKVSQEENNQEKLMRMLSADDFVRYNIIFLIFRFSLHIVLYMLLYLQLKKMTDNHLLAMIGVSVASLVMGNAVNDSDLSFNTYIDVILYQLTMLVILNKKNGWWILLIVIVGAFNRETSLLIPFIYFISQVNFNEIGTKNLLRSIFSQKLFKSANAVLISALSFVFFCLIFIAIRHFVGYQEYADWRTPRGLPMIKLNLLSFPGIKTYNEVFGVVALLPFFGYFYIKKLPSLYCYMLLSFVPIWFFVHLSSVVLYQSRLFLVPTIIVFIPTTIYLISRARVGNNTQMVTGIIGDNEVSIHR